MNLAASIVGLVVALCMLGAAAAILVATCRVAWLFRRSTIPAAASLQLLAMTLVLVALLGRTACETALWAVKQAKPLVSGQVER